MVINRITKIKRRTKKTFRDANKKLQELKPKFKQLVKKAKPKFKKFKKKAIRTRMNIDYYFDQQSNNLRNLKRPF